MRGFSKVSGLKQTTEVVEHRDGGNAVAIEMLEIAHEGVTVDPAGGARGKTSEDVLDIVPETVVLAYDAAASTADIDLGIVNVEIGMAPLRPAEFVIFSIGQKTADAQTEGEVGMVFQQYALYPHLSVADDSETEAVGVIGRKAGMTRLFTEDGGDAEAAAVVAKPKIIILDEPTADPAGTDATRPEFGAGLEAHMFAPQTDGDAFQFRSSDAPGETALHYELSNVLIPSYQISGTGGDSVPVDAKAKPLLIIAEDVEGEAHSAMASADDFFWG